MTRDEQRQAWRVYAAAAISRSEGADFAANWADAMMKEERQRFDAPDHSGDANKMVEPLQSLDLSVTAPFVNTGQSLEPSPWVGLSAAERLTLLDGFFRQARVTLDDLLIRHDQMLREKNGGTQ